ncbi:MAG: hypothetical protein A2X86_16655 [Bdellovibrionales bacterium GWA2_49_15]|nr:MAG: hypothetical protein A2X86_16655 [Bdellovibrionales bacterium GWA2_49_15]HAZ14629.1 hypothetical protein [Bdellovibrionales bacterium]
MTYKIVFCILTSLQLLIIPAGLANTFEVSLSQKVDFKSGDVIKLKKSFFSVQIGSDPGTECAVPGFNCGSGYRPPHPTYKIDCGAKQPCPYIVMASAQDGSSGSLTIEDEKSCEKNNPENCFYEFARQFASDEGCMALKSPSGRYYCLARFDKSARPENRGLCDQLPDAIYALKWNCYYEYAIRYRDPKFCDKYSPKEIDGRDRCLLKMAEIFKDKAFCQKISASKTNSYKEQCL